MTHVSDAEQVLAYTARAVAGGSHQRRGDNVASLRALCDRVGLPRFVVLRFLREQKLDEFAIPAQSSKVFRSPFGAGHQFMLSKAQHLDTFPYVVPMRSAGQVPVADIELLYAGDDEQAALMADYECIPVPPKPLVITLGRRKRPTTGD